jgi:hypothetical protein
MRTDITQTKIKHNMDTQKLLSPHWDHVKNRGYTLFGTYAISNNNYSFPEEEQRCDLYFYGFMIRYTEVEYLKWTVKHNAKFSELESLAKSHFETVLEHNMRCFNDNISAIQNRDEVAQEMIRDIVQIMGMIGSSSTSNGRDLRNILDKKQAELDRLGLPRVETKQSFIDRCFNIMTE